MSKLSFPPGCLDKAVELALTTDKPLFFDYYLQSQNGDCSIKKTESDERILYKSPDEYTSPLCRLLKIQLDGIPDTNHIICETMNSLYLVHSNILKQQ